MKKSLEPRRHACLLLLSLLLLGWTSAGAGQERTTPPQDIRELLPLAQQMESLGRLEQAAELYGRAAILQASRRDLNAYASARSCYQRLKSPDPWEALILELRKRFRSLQFEADLAEIAMMRGDRQAAISLWRQILVENPVEEQAYQLVGAALLNHALYAEAQESYERGRRAFKEPNKYFLELARIHQAQENYPAMVAEYLAWLEKNPAQIHLIQMQLLAAAADPEPAAKIAAALERALAGDEGMKPQGFRLLSALYTQQGDYARALVCTNYLEKWAREHNSGEQGSFYYAFANVAINDGALAEARQALETLTTQEGPQNLYRAHATLALARLLEKEQAYDQAMEAYSAFIRQYPQWPESPTLFLRLAELHYSRYFNLAAADSLYRRLLTWPQLSLPLRLRAWQGQAECAIARGDLTDAEQLLLRLKRDLPAAAPRHQADLLLAQISLFKGHPAQALQRLEGLIQAAPLRSAAKTDTVQNDLLEFYLLLRESRQDSAALATYGSGLWLAEQRRLAEALTQLDLAQQLARSAGLAEKLRFERISLLRRMGRGREALELAGLLAADSTILAPDLALLTVAEIQEESDSPRQALQVLESFLEKYPESIYIEQVRGRIRRMERRPQGL